MFQVCAEPLSERRRAAAFLALAIGHEGGRSPILLLGRARRERQMNNQVHG